MVIKSYWTHICMNTHTHYTGNQLLYTAALAVSNEFRMQKSNNLTVHINQVLLHHSSGMW